nr:SAM-dependent methyltransferase [Spelaeicoccus albus]
MKLLLDPDGYALLDSLPPYDESLAMALSERLRADGHAPALVAAALTQSRLRKKAHEKFADFAADMLFTADGLEQATRLPVAARHAERFAGAGVRTVEDLGCGIGSDSMAFAAMDLNVRAVDSDEVTAAIATMNLRHFPSASVTHARAEDVDLTGADGVWLDPARRDNGSRLFDPEAFSPPLSFVSEVAERVSAVGAKLGPGIPHASIPAGAEAQWVSVDGGVVEAGLWFGALARAGVGKAALVLGPGGAVELTDVDLPGQDVGEVGDYLYEPDGAVIRAGLVTGLLPITDGRLIDPKIAYVTSDRAVDTPLATGYVIDDVLPMSLKKLRAYLAERNVGIVTIKKRGSNIVPEQLRQQLRLSGDNEATIVLTRVGKSHLAMVVRPLEHAGEHAHDKR